MIRFSAQLRTGYDSVWKKIATGKWQSANCHLEILPAKGYSLLEGPDFLIVHDGRVKQWESNPINWNGSFLAVSFKADGGLQLFTDRLGTVPVYWSARNGVSILGSQLQPFILAGYKEPNWLACWQSVFFNVPQWNRTMLEDVCLAPPASRLDFQPGKALDVSCYWVPPLELPAEHSQSYYLSELIERMRMAHRCCLSDAESLAMPVTGGLDSRINLALQQERWHELHLFTGYARGELEAPIVGKVAKVVGRPMLTVQRIDGLKQLLRCNVWSETGELNFAQRWLEDTVQKVALAYPGATLVDGYMQDVMFNPVGPRADSTSLADGIGLARFYYQLLGRDTGDRMLTELLDLFESEYRLEQASSPLEASQRYYLGNRSRRHIFGMVRLTQNWMPVAIPGIDNDLLEFGFSLPWSMRVGSPLYRQAIDALSPDLSMLPYDKTGLPVMSMGGKSRRIIFNQRLSYYLDKLWPTRPFLNGSEVKMTNVIRHYPDFSNSIDSVLMSSKWVAEMLGGRREVAHIVNELRRGKMLGDIVYGLLTIASLESEIDCTGKLC